MNNVTRTAEMLIPERAPGSITEELGHFVAGVNYAELPDETTYFAKALTLKIVAGTVAGARCPNAQKVAALVRKRSLPEEVGVIGCGFRTSAWEGVLLNAFCGHASELEDVGHSPGGVSWDITVIPLMLTLADKLKLSGKSFIEAVAAGLEAHYRTCLPFDATPVGMVLPPTSAMGCAAAAARAFGLDAGQTTAAMGFTLSCSSMAEASMGSDAHFLESSLHAMQGLMGAEMAALGLTSNPDLVSLKGMLAEGVAFDDVTAELGERWFFEEIWIKKYPNCFLIHRQLDALLEIMRDEQLTCDNIRSVEVLTGPGDACCDRPCPATVGDMQFSFQHSLGMAMLKGKLSLDDFLPDAANGPDIEAARRKVSVTVDPDIPYTVSLDEPTTVVVKTTDGKTYSREKLSALGSPDEPLSREQFSDLYRHYAGNGLSDSNVEKTLDMLWNLEKLEDTSELLGILTFGK